MDDNFDLTELPPPDIKRWVVRRKAAVVSAVRNGSELRCPTSQWYPGAQRSMLRGTDGKTGEFIIVGWSGMGGGGGNGVSGGSTKFAGVDGAGGGGIGISIGGGGMMQDDKPSTSAASTTNRTENPIRRLPRACGK